MKGEGGGAMKGLSETRAAEPGVRSTCVRCSWKRGGVRPRGPRPDWGRWQNHVAQDPTEAGGSCACPMANSTTVWAKEQWQTCGRHIMCLPSCVPLSLRQLRELSNGQLSFGVRSWRRRALGWESSNVGNWKQCVGWDGLEWGEGSGMTRRLWYSMGK